MLFFALLAARSGTRRESPVGLGKYPGLTMQNDAFSKLSEGRVRGLVAPIP
jgi:hypothetical protein